MKSNLAGAVFFAGFFLGGLLEDWGVHHARDWKVFGFVFALCCVWVYRESMQENTQVQRSGLSK